MALNHSYSLEVSRARFYDPPRKKKEIEIQMNGKWIAFIQRFANQWPRKALCNIASHSTVHAHTDYGVRPARQQPVFQEQVPCSGIPRHSARRSEVSN